MIQTTTLSGYPADLFTLAPSPPARLGSAAPYIIQGVGTGGAIATPFIAKAISSAAWSVPVVGAAVAGITIALSAWLNRQGPKQKTFTTKLVNDLEPQLQENVDAYLAGPRNRASQAVALAAFDSAWTWLHSSAACGAPELGDPGRRCLSDRERGGPFPWAEWYRDPIANDAVSNDSGSDSVLALFGAGGGVGGSIGQLDLTGLLLPVALIAVGVML
ncbi:hypothetical protein EPO44_10345 [bacterium]|nr:MAG: hypothetical protein EPO44_10345 [bacterium]